MPSSWSPRTIWSISSGENPVISIGASGRPDQMLLHQFLDLGPAVVRRHLDPAVGVLVLQDPHERVQLCPPRCLTFGPRDAGFGDTVVDPDQGPCPAALDGGIFLDPLIQ